MESNMLLSATPLLLRGALTACLSPLARCHAPFPLSFSSLRPFTSPSTPSRFPSRSPKEGYDVGDHVTTRDASASIPADVSSSSHASSPEGQFGHSEEHGNEEGLQVTVEPLSDSLEGISIISLARPRARNSLGRQLVRELNEAIDTVRQETTTRCVVLRSVVPGVFSAGADLRERSVLTHREVMEVVNSLRSTFAAVRHLPMPVICAMDGIAAGGGAELALACDVRVAGPSTAISFPETMWGVIPGAGGTQRLPLVVGSGKARELIFTGRRVAAEEAAALGLIDRLVVESQIRAAAAAAGEVGAAAIAAAAAAGTEAGGRGGEGGVNVGYLAALLMAKDITKGAPLAMRMAKSVLNNTGMEATCNLGLPIEEMGYMQLVNSFDRSEGLLAFRDKRVPVFRGE